MKSKIPIPSTMTTTSVLITGCSKGGIGYSLAQTFAQRGCCVIATARKFDSMAGLTGAQKLTADSTLTAGTIYLCELDVTLTPSIKACVDGVLASAIGKIDILVNNAGMSLVGPIAALDLAQVRSMYETNVFGVISMCQAVFPHMAAAASSSRSSSCSKKIINIGSIAGDVSSPFGGSYSSTKAALKLITDSLRMECHPFGIQVCLIKPGAIRSNIGNQNVSNLKGGSNAGNAGNGSLAAAAFYKPWERFIQERAMSSQSPKSTPTLEFADRVVEIVLSAKLPPYFAYGHMTWLFFLLRTLVPVFISDFFFRRKFGLNS